MATCPDLSMIPGKGFVEFLKENGNVQITESRCESPEKVKNMVVQDLLPVHLGCPL